MDREIFQTPESNLERSKVHYFETTPSTNPSVKRVADFIREENKRKNFIEKLIKYDGIAIWEKAIVTTYAQESNSIISNLSASTQKKNTSSSVSADTVVFIPLVPKEDSKVYSFIQAKVKGDKISWRLFSGRDYDNYKHGSITDKEINAEKLAAITMMLENKCFGYTNFILTAKSLFSNQIKTTDLTRIKIVNNEPDIALNSIKSSSYYAMQFCFSVGYISCPFNALGINCRGEGGTCDRCEQCTRYTLVCDVAKIIYIPEGGGGGGGTVTNYDPGGGGGGGGSDGIVGNGDSVDDPCDISSPCGRLGWTSEQALAINLRPKLGISLSEYSSFLTWVSENPTRAVEILDFLEQSNYSDLSISEKTDIAKEHYNNLISDPEYKIFVETITSSSVSSLFSMTGLFKELATEIGFKIVKKYLPGYADWQSIKDALDNANHGDWISMLGEIINITKKKVPFLAVFNAIYDAFDFGRVARAAWKAFDKIKEIPGSALDGLISTMKSKCGGIIGNLTHDESLGSNSIQAFLKYNPNDAENFFRTLAQNIGATVNNTSSPGRFYFDVAGYRFNYYPDSSSPPHYNTIEIVFPNNAGRYKLRFLH